MSNGTQRRAFRHLLGGREKEQGTVCPIYVPQDRQIPQVAPSKVAKTAPPHASKESGLRARGICMLEVRGGHLKQFG